MIYQTQKQQEHADVVVCGGGLAGVAAAIAAARQGMQTIIIQDRPVFGGNSSSEVRVTPHGAAQFHGYARETGIISELLIEERAQNHEVQFENGWTNSMWDMILYDKVMQTPNLRFHLNTSIIEVIMRDDRHIAAVVCRTANAETEITISGKIFIDCTGDGIVAAMSGCEWRMGSEGRSEFNEPHAPSKASGDTMGSSIHIRARDMGRPVPYTLPSWAKQYDDAGFFYDAGRIPHDPRGGFWWIEIGMPWHTIHNNEEIRHELTRHALGVWDWIKNKDPRLKAQAANYGLDWIGQVPGKRESRRIIGQYFMTEHDVLQKTVFPDEIAFGGWFVDLHTPGGLLAEHSEPASATGYNETTDYAVRSYVGPYGIPLRIMIARDVDNLLMAGRCVSVSHAALGTVRVMATTALMGEAAGIAAGVALDCNIPLADVPHKQIHTVQQQLLRGGAFLPNTKNEDTYDIAQHAQVTASSSDVLIGAGLQRQGWYYDRLVSWDDNQTNALQPVVLNRRQGQWIAVNKGHLKTVSVCLTNRSSTEQVIEAQIIPVEHIWDYDHKTQHSALATTALRVPPGEAQWIEWGVELDNEANGYIRLDLLPNPQVMWHVSGALIPGHLAAYEPAVGRMRRFYYGHTMTFKVDPPQAVFEPDNVISGVARPHRFTNLWRSNPLNPLPQWIELTWDAPQQIQHIELTFPGYITREYHAYPPFFRDPECAAEYGIQFCIDNTWVELIRVTDNYQRIRKHRLANAVTAQQMRVMIYTTNGDSAAGLYEIRCYV
jgi:hypothetical protein